jgi:hypothetical protein
MIPDIIAQGMSASKKHWPLIELLAKHKWNDEVKKDEMGRTCSTNGETNQPSNFGFLETQKLWFIILDTVRRRGQPLLPGTHCFVVASHHWDSNCYFPVSLRSLSTILRSCGLTNWTESSRVWLTKAAGSLTESSPVESDSLRLQGHSLNRVQSSLIESSMPQKQTLSFIRLEMCGVGDLLEWNAQQMGFPFAASECTQLYSSRLKSIRLVRPQSSQSDSIKLNWTVLDSFKAPQALVQSDSIWLNWTPFD